MEADEYRSHDRTLLGALDSYTKALVHVRPWLAGSYRRALEHLAETWLRQRGNNAVDAIDSTWLRAYLFEAGQDSSARAAISDFYAWAVREGLLERPPISDRG